MADKMLIDATHPEETRVVVLRGNRVEEFDFESANRKQLRGNIYLAKVTRVEPSLQAAFVDYGGNRHGFLAFSEIHPDYYQIPVADRQALIAQEERDQRDADAEAERRAGRRGRRHRHRGAERHRDRDVVQSEPLPAEQAATEATEAPAADNGFGESAQDQLAQATNYAAGSETAQSEFAPDAQEHEPAEMSSSEEPAPPADAPLDTIAEGEQPSAAAEGALTADTTPDEAQDHSDSPAIDAAENGNGEEHPDDEAVESVGGADALEEVQERLPRFRRQYKIQEVIKRRQVMLVQVVKEERGTKGAALTTYLSLAGRYSVLMPNTARGGGISRKVTNSDDRRRMKEIAEALQVPEGMGVILRTAGANRTDAEVQRDFEYLLRLWETVRDLTLKSTAPSLVYEEGSLIKRSIRDLYNKDIDEVLVAGDDAYREAKDFMRMLMPSHAKNVKPYKEPEPVFIRYQVERQLAAMFSPQVVLKSGGYIVINQTEALVSIDVNSGKATREHNIEDTALKTNLEAAEEIARQLRLRDLAGLIVIDFIDMDEKRNNRAVERKLSDCLRQDRARIQVGRISHFGLLEMSRQRIRSSVLESSTEPCPMCQGTGMVRSVESVALDILRSIEDRLITDGVVPLVATTAVDVALYILNQKRSHLNDIQQRYQVPIMVNADEDMHISQFVIERAAEGEITNGGGAVVHMDWAHHQEEPAQAAVPVRAPAQAAEAEGEQGHRQSRRRRRRGGGRLHEGGAEHAHRAHVPETRQSEEEAVAAEGEVEEAASSEARAEPQVRKGSRRRGRRGGRRGRSRERQLGGQESAEAPRESHGEVQERKPAFTQGHVGETDFEVRLRQNGSEHSVHEHAEDTPAREAPEPRHREPESVFETVTTSSESPAPPSEPISKDQDQVERPPRRGWWR